MTDSNVWPIDAVLSGLLILVLLFAAREDLLNHRIPNVLVAIAAGAALSIQTYTHGWDGGARSLLGTLTGLAIFLPLYALRGMGAGDVKLMGAVGSFLGPFDALAAAAATLIVGAVLAIGVVLWKLAEQARGTQAYVPSLLGTVSDASLITRLRRERFPYATAIAGGTLLVLWYQGGLAHVRELFIGWVGA